MQVINTLVCPIYLQKHYGQQAILRVIIGVQKRNFRNIGVCKYMILTHILLNFVIKSLKNYKRYHYIQTKAYVKNKQPPSDYNLKKKNNWTYFTFLEGKTNPVSFFGFPPGKLCFRGQVDIYRLLSGLNAMRQTGNETRERKRNMTSLCSIINGVISILRIAGLQDKFHRGK